MSAPPKSPGRPPADESGAKVPVKLGLSPRHRAILDDLAAKRGVSRSEVVAKLLERTVPKVDPVEAAAARRS